VVLDAARGTDVRFVRVVCVVAPTDRWAPGLEDTVLGFATWTAHKSLAAEPVRLAAGTIDGDAPAGGADSHFRQGFASAETGTGVAGFHELGFVGGEGLACSLGCVESGASSEECARIAKESHVEAAFSAQPPANWIVRVGLFVAERPVQSGALGLVVGGAILATWIARRPRFARG